jgi:hypothetical protein
MAGIVLRFTLVDEYYRPVSTFDKLTKKKIVGETRVKTDAKGEFRVSLWPNTRGDRKTYYLVQSDAPGVERFASVLVESPDPITLFDFKNLYRDIPFTEYNLISEQVSAILSNSTKTGKFIVIDPSLYSIPVEGNIIPGTEEVCMNGMSLTAGNDNDYILDEGSIKINEEHVLTEGDIISFRYNIKVTI